MTRQYMNELYFDNEYAIAEQLPRRFSVTFRPDASKKNAVRVILNDTIPVGDVVNDNSFEEDFYRYHDVFHYAFAAMLGWSPCSRSMMKRKRKSNPTVDEVEDGARAAITEESLSLLIFNESKRNGFYKNGKVSNTLLQIVKEMTEPFEVRSRTEKEWEAAILKAYQLFRLLVQHNGGKIEFDASERTAHFLSLN
jgi:hypothetical protein